MSETSETKGRCRSEVDDRCGSPCELVIAGAIDRLAADVAAVKEAVCDGSVAAAIRERDEARAEVERLRGEVEGDDRLIDQLIALNSAVARQRDEARAEVERLNAELATRPADGNRQATLDSSPAAPQPAAPPAGWLTDRERTVLELIAMERRTDSDLHWFDDVLPAIRSILSRAGSPPVVEVPVMVFGSGSYEMQKRYRAAMDRAGVAWKEVGRE